MKVLWIVIGALIIILEPYPAKSLEVIMRKIDVCDKNLDDWNRKDLGMYNINLIK